MLSVGLAPTIWRVGLWPPMVDRQLLRRMLALSLPLIAFAVSQYVIRAVDVVILGAYRPARDVGLYAIAYQGYGLLQQVATTATIVLSPLFVSLRLASREHLLTRYYGRTVPQVIFLAAVGAGLVVPVIGIVVPTVLGRAFAPASEPLSILLVAWVLFAAASFVAPILVLHERARAIGAVNVAAALVNIAGDWLLVGEFGLGIVGPALVTVASLAVITIGYFYVAADCVGHPRELPLAFVAPTVVAIVPALILPDAVGAVASVGATLLTATVIARWKKPFGAQDIDLIGKLDIPAPVKKLALRGLRRLG